MGRGKKKSIRCKTSKKEYKHTDKKRQSKQSGAQPSVNRYKVPLNQIIDHHGKSSKFMHAHLLQLKRKRAPLTLTPDAKLKVDSFLFGAPLKQSLETEIKTAEHSNDIAAAPSQYCILKIFNLHARVNSKILVKIINRLLQQEIPLHSIDIATASSGRYAKIEMDSNTSGLTTQIKQQLDGKKLFGKILHCEFVL